MFCVNCGLQIPDHVNFCPQCGQKTTSKKNSSVPEITSTKIPEIIVENRDELFEEAARLIVSMGQGSISLLQRRLKIGYSRAGHIMDELHQVGIVGPPEGTRFREVHLKPDELEILIQNLRQQRQTLEPTNNSDKTMINKRRLKSPLLHSHGLPSENDTRVRSLEEDENKGKSLTVNKENQDTSEKERQAAQQKELSKFRAQLKDPIRIVPINTSLNDAVANANVLSSRQSNSMKQKKIESMGFKSFLFISFLSTVFSWAIWKMANGSGIWCYILWSVILFIESFLFDQFLKEISRGWFKNRAGMKFLLWISFLPPLLFIIILVLGIIRGILEKILGAKRT
jgi:hypothetical protein